MNSIESEPNVTLRPLTEADAVAYFALIDSNREYFANFDNMSPDKYPTVESVREALAEPSKTRWGMFIGNQLIGSINLKPTDVPGVGEIGYIMAEAFARRGHTTDAVRKAVREIPGDYTALIATTNPANMASQRVLLKSGFVFTHDNEEGEHVYRLERG